MMFFWVLDFFKGLLNLTEPSLVFVVPGLST